MNLREATAELHSKAEKMEFNQKMFKGELSKKEYVNYLGSQLLIFSAIEKKELKDFPTQLNRVSNIKLDIAELSEESISELQSAKEYADYLDTLEGEQLNSHIYLNYLAIMFGGQMMKYRIPGSGRMYDFEGDRNVLIAAVRKLVAENEKHIDEVNKGYNYVINIFDELQKNS